MHPWGALCSLGMERGKVMLIGDKIPTLPMKTLTGVLEAAGRAAYFDGYPWTSAFGYAAAVVGTSDCNMLWESAMRYLRGWIAAREEDEPGSVPAWLKKVPDLDPRALP